VRWSSSGCAALGLALSLALALAPGAAGQETPRLIVLDGEVEDQAVAELVLRAGSALEPASQAGLASVLAGVLAAEVDVGAGAVVLGWAEPDRIALRVLAPPDSIVPITERLLRVLSEPTLAQDAVEMERTRVRAALQSRLLSPEAVAARSLTQRVFPDHPYGVLETPATIANVDREAMVSFQRRHVGPTGALLVVGGVGGSEATRTELEAVLSRWRSRAPSPSEGNEGVESGPGEAVMADGPTDAGDATLPSGGVPVHIVDVPGAARASIHVGQALPSIPPREWAALTTGVELAALENARTFRRWESFQGSLGPVPSVGGVTRQRLAGFLRFQVQVPTAEADRALQTVLETAARAGRALYPADRIDAVRTRLLETLREDRSTIERVARLGAYYSVGLGTDPDGAFGDWLGTLDAYDVRDAMANWVHGDSVQVVVAGDATVLTPLLRSFGPMTVSDAEAGTVANGDRPVPTGFGMGTGPSPAAAADLAPGRWRYRVLIQGRDQGEMLRVLRREEDGAAMTVRTVLEAAGLVQDASVRFDPVTMEMVEASLKLRGGADDVETELVRDGRLVRGRWESRQEGVSRAIEGEAPPGVLVGELLELALWRMELNVGDHVRLPFLDPGTGQGQIADVVVLGTGTEFGPRGEEATVVVEVVTGGLRQRLHMRAQGLHVPLSSEIVGQSLRLELIEEGVGAGGPG
jgi:predicted Zn-dependent peptidase